MLKESEVRDRLAAKLEILEQGLVLVKREQRLPNPHGAKGYIDILAKDKAGNYVIIELKNSDRTAREAVQEILKYHSLVRVQYRVHAHSIRCVIVSTDWHELLVPFSELSLNPGLQLQGFQLHVDADGCPVSASQIKPIAFPPVRDPYPVHYNCVYASAQERQGAARLHARALSEVGATSFVMMCLDPGVGMTATEALLYIVLYELSESAIAEVRAVLRKNADPECQPPPDHIVIPDMLFARAMSKVPRSHTELLAGSSERLAAILKEGWQCSHTIREGKVPSVELVSDEELAIQIRGLKEGRLAASYMRRARPADHLDWREFRKTTVNALECIPVWQTCCKWFCEKYSREYPDAEFAVSVYAPRNLPLTIYKLATKADDRVGIPFFELGAALPDKSRAWIVRGVIEWNAATRPASVAEAFSIVEGLTTALMIYGLYPMYEDDSRIMRAHGLNYGLEYTHYTKTWKETHAIVQDPEAPECDYLPRAYSEPSIDDFMTANATYVAELVETMRTMFVGTL